MLPTAYVAVRESLDCPFGQSEFDQIACGSTLRELVALIDTKKEAVQGIEIAAHLSDGSTFPVPRSFYARTRQNLPRWLAGWDWLPLTAIPEHVCPSVQRQ